MKPTPADDATEHRRGRVAGIAAFVSVAASIAALAVANSATSAPVTEPGAALAGDDADRRRHLIDFHASHGDQALAAALRGVGVLLCIGVGLYLLWLVRRRGADVSDGVRWSIIAGPLLMVAASVVGFLAFRDVADQFVASGPQTNARAKQLIDDDGTLRAAGIFDIVARAVFAIWVGILSAGAMRVELMTSFLGYWGIAAAGALVLLPIGDAMFIGWLVSIGFLAVGYWPGGRPAAWNPAAGHDVP